MLRITTDKYNRSIIRINKRIVAYYESFSSFYNFYLGKPSDRIVYGKNGLNEDQLKEEIKNLEKHYEEFLSFINC